MQSTYESMSVTWQSVPLLYMRKRFFLFRSFFRHVCLNRLTSLPYFDFKGLMKSGKPIELGICREEIKNWYSPRCLPLIMAGQKINLLLYWNCCSKSEYFCVQEQTVPIAELPDGGEIQTPKFHTEAFRRVFEGVPSDMPLLSIAITGMMRSGKSFLLNLMVTYLEYLLEVGFATTVVVNKIHVEEWSWNGLINQTLYYPYTNANIEISYRSVRGKSVAHDDCYSMRQMLVGKHVEILWSAFAGLVGKLVSLEACGYTRNHSFWVLLWLTRR